MNRLGCATLVLAMGCTSPPATGRLAARFHATYDEMGDLRLGLQLTEPGVGPEGDAPYALSPGEGVRVGFRGQTIPLVAGTDYVLGDGYYATITPGSPPTAEEPITLTFDRGGSDRVTLELDAPPDFVLSVPAASPQPVTISWAPIAAEPMHWYTSFDEGPIPHDTGSIEFPTSVVGVTAASDVDFAFTRTRTIVAKTALHSASATYTWEHSITVEVTP